MIGNAKGTERHADGTQTPAPRNHLLLFVAPGAETNSNFRKDFKRTRNMRYLHTMLRVRNLDTAMKFYRDALGLKEVRRVDNDKGRFTLVFLCAPEDEGLFKAAPQNGGAPVVELTDSWDEEKYGEARYFGHLA